MTPVIKHTALLELLAMAIFADKHVYSAEIQTFVSVSQKLYEDIYPEEEVSGASILLWYEQNKESLLSKVSGDFEPWLNEILPQLADIENKAAILQGIRKISLADEDDHVSEKALTVLVASEWGVTTQQALAH